MISVLVPAAGRGVRMGGGIKALMPLAGRPMILWSLDALRAVPDAGEVLVAAPPEATAEFESLREKTGAWTETVEGGETRSASVRAMLERARGNRVLVHDAARPCITTQWVTMLLEELGKAPAGIPAVPVRDTLKEVRQGTVLRTIDRGALQAVQTPQIFDRELLRRAHQNVGAHSEDVTDDAMLVERLGQPVRVLKGLPTNVKVTYPEDVAVAMALLESAARLPGEGDS